MVLELGQLIPATAEAYIVAIRILQPWIVYVEPAADATAPVPLLEHVGTGAFMQTLCGQYQEVSALSHLVLFDVRKHVILGIPQVVHRHLLQVVDEVEDAGQ